MMKIIRESDIRFGEFDTDRLFEIEKACRNNKIGKGIKTVELIYLTEYDVKYYKKDYSNRGFLDRQGVSVQPRDKDEAVFGEI